RRSPRPSPRRRRRVPPPRPRRRRRGARRTRRPARSPRPPRLCARRGVAPRVSRGEGGGEPPAARAARAARAGPETHLDPPWEGYDAMALDEVLGRLQAADPTTLAAVRLYESTHEQRQAIL